MGGFWAAESCQGAAQPSTGQRSGEAGWRPIHRLAAGHAGGSRGAAAFALHGELLAFRRLQLSMWSRICRTAKKESEVTPAAGGLRWQADVSPREARERGVRAPAPQPP